MYITHGLSVQVNRESHEREEKERMDAEERDLRQKREAEWVSKSPPVLSSP